MELWRICQRKHAGEAFTGDGSRLYAGRWHERGTAVVYLSATLSLAALECLAHVDPDLAPHDFVAFGVTVPRSVRIEVLSDEELPMNWQADPPPASTQALGTRWIRSGTTALLSVPSALIPIERNVLLNPAHTHFGRLAISRPRPFAFDARLLRT